jgi:hypothetical protein
MINTESLDRISVSTSASHALEPGSIPGPSNLFFAVQQGPGESLGDIEPLGTFYHFSVNCEQYHHFSTLLALLTGD